MAKVVQITWVRQYRNDATAADFGVAFGKEADIEAAALDLDALLRGDHDSIPKEYEDKLNSAKALVSVVCGLSAKPIANFMLSALEESEIEAFIDKAQKKKPKRHYSIARRLAMTIRGMDQLERMAAMLSVLRKLPDNAFTLCDHQPDWSSVHAVETRGDIFEVTCKHDCGAVAHFAIDWDEDADDDEDDDGDDEDDDGDEEDFDDDGEGGYEDEDDEDEDDDDEDEDDPPRRPRRRPAMKGR